MVKLAQMRPRLSVQAPRLKPQPKQADPFYLSSEWRALVARLIRERGRRCQLRLARCSDDGSGTLRLFADHIREIADGGALLAPENVQLLCGSCHTTKTQRARAARMAAMHGPSEG